MVMEKNIGRTRLTLLKGDITEQDTDVIVNAANSSLMGGGGVDGAIHRAGGPVILAECKKIVAKEGPCPTGRAVITTAGTMPSKYVIHTVGPIWRRGGDDEEKLLAVAYENCLRLAYENKLHSLAFPSISTGVYHFPVAKAAEIALLTIIAFLKQHPEAFTEVRCVLFSAADYEVYAQKLITILS